MNESPLSPLRQNSMVENCDVELPGSQHEFLLTTFALIAVALPICLLTMSTYPLITIAVAALLWGWSEVIGVCGSSHIGTITPLRCDKSGRIVWFRAILAYTTWGLITSVTIGFFVGGLALVLNPHVVPKYVVLHSIALFSVALILRELGIVRFSLPTTRLQTEKFWAFEFGIVPAASMWGAHIGLGFATVVTHSGFYLLVIISAILGPKNGAMLFAVYWLGRTLPIWAAPYLTKFKGNTEELLSSVIHGAPAYTAATIFGLIVSVFALLKIE